MKAGEDRVLDKRRSNLQTELGKTRGNNENALNDV